MASPVELCMKSMRNTTGLGSGAGVVVLRRFRVTLSAQRRGFGCRTRSNRGLRRVAEALTDPLSLMPFTERLGKRRWGRKTGGRAPSHPFRTCTARQSRAQMARPVELCMKSMRNTTGLGCGAGVVVLCRFPVTLSAQRRDRPPPTLSPCRLTEPTARRSCRESSPSPRTERAGAHAGLPLAHATMFCDSSTIVPSSRTSVGTL